MSNVAAAFAGVIIASSGTHAIAGEYPALTDFRTYCVANQADPAAIQAAAQKEGWALSEATDRGTELKRTDGDQERSLYLSETIQDGVRVRGCLAGLTPGSAEVYASIQKFMGQAPTNMNGGYARWTFIDRDGKKTFLSGQEASDANQRGETIVEVSAGLRGPLAAMIYTEVSKAGN